MLIPVSTRTMANATAQATPRERALFIIFREMVPPVRSSTCSLRICTAGSAFTR